MPWWDLGSLSPVKSLKGIFQDVSGKKLEISANANPCVSPCHIPLIEHKNEEYRMREAQLGSHTLMSHGVTVARTHMHDWLILLLLVFMEVILYVIHPFYRFVGKDMMDDLRYPLKSNTVPVWAVPMYAVLLPMMIFFVVYLRRRDVYDLHHAILGLLFSVLVTAVITDSIKNAVGRPRPDFFWRCFPDGKDVYDKWGDVICHGDKSVIKEGHKSFPSGHTSWLVMATFCYLQFFPPPYHTEGWGPYAYFRVLEESRQQAMNSVNSRNGQATEDLVESEQDGSSNGFLGLHLAGNSSSTLLDAESGRS